MQPYVRQLLFLIGINVIRFVHRTSFGRWYVASCVDNRKKICYMRGTKRDRVREKNLSTWHATVFTMQWAFYEFILCRSFFPMFVCLFNSWMDESCINWSTSVRYEFYLRPSRFACRLLNHLYVHTYLIAFFLYPIFLPFLYAQVQTHTFPFLHWFSDWFPDLAAIVASLDPGGIE